MRAFATASFVPCRWSAVDLAAGAIRVTESWDPKEGAIAPKTKNSQRTTPLPGLLRDYLMEHRIATGEPPVDALVFGDESGKPFQAATIYRRADRAWGAQALGRLRLHQARHTYASFMIAAGVNAKALSSFMGHSSIKVTVDLYGHLMPGTEPRPRRCSTPPSLRRWKRESKPRGPLPSRGRLASTDSPRRSALQELRAQLKQTRGGRRGVELSALAAQVWPCGISPRRFDARPGRCLDGKPSSAPTI
jgi:hypothetical protein